ncbi:MAG: hypothetical protein V1727_00965 [Candidatus Omnitrophota bacterium]
MAIPLGKEDYQTKADILETFGKPYYQDGYKDVGVWYYEEQRMFIFFDGDKVVRIDYMAAEEI